MTTHEAQRHFGTDSAAACGKDQAVYLHERQGHLRECRAISAFRCDVRGYANPIPSPEEFVTGIEHKNDRAENTGVPFNVVRAIATELVHNHNRLEKEMKERPQLLFNKLKSARLLSVSLRQRSDHENRAF